MSSCDSFTGNAWRPDLCATCQRSRAEHEGQSPGGRTWRRRSEPDPNNIISGNRISVLSKNFQRSGSIPDAAREKSAVLNKFGATLPKPQKTKPIPAAKEASRNSDSSLKTRLNGSRSADFLDSSSTPPSPEKKSPVSSTAVDLVPNSSSSTSSSLTAKTVKPSVSVNSTSKSDTSASPSSSSTSAPAPSVSSKPSAGHSTRPKPTNHSKAAHKTSTSSNPTPRSRADSDSKKTPGKPETKTSKDLHSTSATSTTDSKTKQKPTSQSRHGEGTASTSLKQSNGSASVPSATTRKQSSSEAVEPTSSALKSSSGSSEKRRKDSNKRVSINSESPEIIGTDGGLDNFAPEDPPEGLTEEDSREIILSLTDEEKQFALLALGNTVWNSDTRNLQVDQEESKRACREFEDLEIESLWLGEGFKTVVNCDSLKPTPSSDFGTFPQVSANRPKNPNRISLQSIGKSSGVVAIKTGNAVMDGIAEKNLKSQGHSSVDRVKGSSSSATSGNSSMTSLNSDGEGRGNSYSGSSGSADSGVEIGSSVDVSHGSGGSTDRPSSYTLGDITDCLYETVDEALESDANRDRPFVKARSAKGSQDTAQSSSDMSFAESTLEGFQAIELLNDVLRDYGGLNESSTDDVVETTTAQSKKEAPKGKKSSAFEARMASVAANLDLTKQQQQRKKSQAPRPPVSPPPEPSVQQGVSPKKLPNQPDPVFKMVPVGRAIMPVPPQSDVPKQTKNPNAPAGLEEFMEAPDSPTAKLNGDGTKSKKGITSFFKNILRRGKESSESFESLNSDIQLNVKPETPDSTQSATTSSNGADEVPGSPPVSVQAGKILVIPPVSASPNKKTTDDLANTGTPSADSDNSTQSPQPPSSTAMSMLAGGTPLLTSPPATRKTSKGLASPKMILKRATAKFSPPVSRHATKVQEKENSDHQPSSPPPSSTNPLASATSSSTSSLTPSSKPYLAPKPSVPPPFKPPPSSTSSSSTPSLTSGSSSVAPATASKEGTPAGPNVVRRRAKSPKRTAPPVPPSRTSVGPVKAHSLDSARPNADLTKELERRLGKDQPGSSSTLTRSEMRESTRRSMPVPPPSPPKEKNRPSSPAHSPPISPIRETENSLPSSPASPTASFEFPNNEWSGGSTSTMDEDLPPKLTEKIELPTVANHGRKGILGKLSSVNRKTKAPQPPSVKRAKSITESSTLPRGDKKNKKIKVADISGPVMVTDITNSKVLEHRRNTISLGDESSLGLALPTTNPPPAPVPSNPPMEKSGFDEFDFPVLSPLGSLENLYESILPKNIGDKFHYYDPPTSSKNSNDGYLEPVTPASLLAAVCSGITSATTSGSTTSTAAGLSGSTLPTSSSLSSAAVTSVSNLPPSLSASCVTSTEVSSVSLSSSDSSTTTNVSLGKSPLRAKTKVSSGVSKSLDNVFDSNSAHIDYRVSSTSSSESNSAENSGNSLPDSFLPGKVGANFVEPDMTDSRRILLASQPIYEEIPNGLDEVEEEKKKPSNVKSEKNSKPAVSGVGGGATATRPKSKKADMTASFHGAVLPGQGQGGRKQTESPQAPSTSSIPSSSNLQSSMMTSSASSSSSSSSAATVASALSISTLTTSSFGALPSSPSKLTHHASSSSLMSTSMTSSMLPPPPPPPDHLPVPSSTSRSVSKETVSSESDTQSNCGTLPRPRAAPRRRAKRPDTGGSDQYVSMNKPNLQISLSEEKLRDLMSKVSSLTFQSLQEIYIQCERILSVDRLDLVNPHQLKWSEFDIYGQPLHASGRCIVYNAKFKLNASPCQVMILHSRPATEMCQTSHPSLLRPSAVFADTIPFSYLTADFIKTSQLLQNSVYDSCQARCFVAVGVFDVVESLDSHLSLLRETMALDPNAYLSVTLTSALQLLSAMSHCLDQGFSVTETDYNDVFLITRADLRGKVVAFLPHQRSLDVPQGEAMCNFLDRLLVGAMPPRDGEDDEEDASDEDDDEDGCDRDRIISTPKKVVAKLRSILEPRRVECLGQVRTAIEYLLWGPGKSDIPISPGGTSSKNATGGSKEQEFYVWLEVQRTQTVGRLARNVGGLSSGLNLDEYYTLKFLLKSSALCLTESMRRLSH